MGARDLPFQRDRLSVYQTSLRGNDDRHEALFFPADQLHGTVFLPFFQDEDAHVGRIPRGSGGDRLLLVSLCDPV